MGSYEEYLREEDRKRNEARLQGINEHGRTDQGRTDQGRTDYGRSDYGRGDQGRSDYGRSDYGRNDGRNREREMEMRNRRESERRGRSAYHYATSKPGKSIHPRKLCRTKEELDRELAMYMSRK